MLFWLLLSISFYILIALLMTKVSKPYLQELQKDYAKSIKKVIKLQAWFRMHLTKIKVIPLRIDR